MQSHRLPLSIPLLFWKRTLNKIPFHCIHRVQIHSGQMTAEEEHTPTYLRGRSFPVSSVSTDVALSLSVKRSISSPSLFRGMVCPSAEADTSAPQWKQNFAVSSKTVLHSRHTLLIQPVPSYTLNTNSSFANFK